MRPPRPAAAHRGRRQRLANAFRQRSRGFERLPFQARVELALQNFPSAMINRSVPTHRRCVLEKQTKLSVSDDVWHEVGYLDLRLVLRMTGHQGDASHAAGRNAPG